MANLISFDLKADFGFFKKPEVNKVYLTYSIPPKPLILGILGAILGMKGLKGQYYEGSKFPEYYEKLKDLKIGIVPKKKNFPFNKIMNKYNNRNAYFYTSDKGDDNSPQTEQLLIKPHYKIYIYSEEENGYFNDLKDNLQNRKTFFMPYLGKNDFPLEIENFQIYNDFRNLQDSELDEKLSLEGVHIHKPSNEKTYDASRYVIFESMPTKSKKIERPFDFYENIPLSYNEKTMLYELKTMRYTNKEIEKIEIDLEKGEIIELSNKKNIYIF